MGRRILCVHAHPDDAELLAGGTLTLLARRGHSVTIASMSAGDCGSTEHGGRETAAIRQKEAARAAARMGAEYHWLGFCDLAIFVDDPSRRMVTAALRRFRPDVVLTASPADYHCDHEATSALVTDACFAASAPNYDTRGYDPAPALDVIPHLYYVDPAEGIDRERRLSQPVFVVDVGAVIEDKRQALECHESQRSWLCRQHGIEDFAGTMLEWTRARGALARVEFGEGFRPYHGHAYPQTPLLEELLGSAVIPL